MVIEGGIYVKQEDQKHNLAENEQAASLAANLLKDQDSIDLGSLMGLAKKLLSNDSLMGMVEGMGKSENQTNSSQSLDLNGMDDLSVLQTQINDLRKEIVQIKKDVAELKKQDSSILTIGMKAIHSKGRDLLKGVSLLTGVRSLLK